MYIPADDSCYTDTETLIESPATNMRPISVPSTCNTRYTLNITDTESHVTCSLKLARVTWLDTCTVQLDFPPKYCGSDLALDQMGRSEPLLCALHLCVLLIWLLKWYFYFGLGIICSWIDYCDISSLWIASCIMQFDRLFPSFNHLHF